MVTLREVAKIAGVSVSTASMALNGSERISSKTREKVFEVAERLGYIPNSLARHLVTKRTQTIGVFVAEVVNPYHATLVRCVREELYRRGYRMYLGITGGDSKVEERMLRDFIALRVDGVLIHTADIVGFSFPTFYELARRKVPTVLVGESIEGLPLPAVEIRLEKGMYELTRYLISQGYRYFLLLSGKKGVATFKKRIDGFQRALVESNPLIQGYDVIETSPDFAGGYESIFRIVKKGSCIPYDVVMCVNDYMASGVLKALRELGIRVPKRIGVTGFDDVFLASVVSVPLTTVRIPIDQLVAKSVDLLFRQLDAADEPWVALSHLEYVDVETVVRQSTRYLNSPT